MFWLERMADVISLYKTTQYYKIGISYFYIISGQMETSAIFPSSVEGQPWWQQLSTLLIYNKLQEGSTPIYPVLWSSSLVKLEK